MILNLKRVRSDKRKLEVLGEYYREVGDDGDIDFSSIIGADKNLNSRLVDAGYIDSDEQSQVNKTRNILILLFTALSGALAFLVFKSIIALVVGFVIGLYIASIGWLLWLKAKARDVLRSAYFDLPLILEELILLIESGLGLFPAMEKVCQLDRNENVNKVGLCRKVFRKSFQLAVHGMPISQAFSVVSKSINCIPLKQVLIHLDVSASIGGELLTSLRALSDQVHKEWKMQVETRVRKLENIVVFPVFMAVMGLLLLTSAVPLVPVFEFMSSLNKTNSGGAATNSNVAGLSPVSIDKLGDNK
jgi:Flp pilus assembly protein TadB